MPYKLEIEINVERILNGIFKKVPLKFPKKIYIYINAQDFLKEAPNKIIAVQYPIKY